MRILYCRSHAPMKVIAAGRCVAAGAVHHDAAGDHVDVGEIEVDDDPPQQDETKAEYLARLEATYGDLMT